MRQCYAFSACRTKEKISWITVLNYMRDTEKAHAQSSYTHHPNHPKTHFYVPHGWNNWSTLVYIQKLFLIKNWAEWMKGICHKWSRGRHFFPSLPGDRYLKLGSKSDLRAKISGSIVWYDALAPLPEVLLLWYFVCTCAATLELKFSPHPWRKYPLKVD